MKQARKLLITGGLGYVGGRIASHLEKVSPVSIRIMTHRSNNTPPDWARKFEICYGDMEDTDTLVSAVRDMDAVIHLAALNELESQDNHIKALYVNGVGTNKLLEACLSMQVKQFIYFSTFHVYGPSSTQPISENSPTRPVHPYAFTHRIAEDYVNWYSRTSDINTLILRLSNGYGYPMTADVNRWSLVFNDLCNQAINQKNISLKSSGRQHRDFISLQNVARAVEHFLFAENVTWGDGLFNLGGNCSLSISEVASIIAQEYSFHYGIDLPITLGSPDINETSDKVSYNIDKLLKTGFTLIDNMKEEIHRTFEICNLKNEKK
tara:strand:- start:1027 stop:1992 length:966 start_codon:yes stop_codon:yes gene_type:complete